MSYERWQMRDPLDVLIRKGEDCHGCRDLERWVVLGKESWRCDNKDAPIVRRGRAPERRCDEWKPERGNSGV